jgi:hypothetical protein
MMKNIGTATKIVRLSRGKALAAEIAIAYAATGDR